MPAHQLFEISQQIVSKNSNGGVLILQYNWDGTCKWMLPGGRINEGENWLAALKREVQEETGIKDFSIKSILEVDSVIDAKPKYIVTFICEFNGIPEIKLSSEHVAFAWITKDNIDEFEFWHESIKKRIQKAL